MHKLAFDQRLSATFYDATMLRFVSSSTEILKPTGIRVDDQDLHFIHRIVLCQNAINRFLDELPIVIGVNQNRDVRPFLASGYCFHPTGFPIPSRILPQDPC